MDTSRRGLGEEGKVRLYPRVGAYLNGGPADTAVLRYLGALAEKGEAESVHVIAAPEHDGIAGAELAERSHGRTAGGGRGAARRSGATGVPRDGRRWGDPSLHPRPRPGPDPSRSPDPVASARPPRTLSAAGRTLPVRRAAGDPVQPGPLRPRARPYRFLASRRPRAPAPPVDSCALWAPRRGRSRATTSSRFPTATRTRVDP